MNTFIELFIKGGPLMYPIVLCSIVSCAVFFERLYHFKRASLNLDPFMKKLCELMRSRRWVEAITLCSDSPGPVAAVLKNGIIKHDENRELIKESIENSITHEMPRLERNVQLLSISAHIAPLLGLLGTVLGMIECFRVIQTKAGIVNPTDLAGGISVALITTAAGLTVAIPSFLAYSFTVARIDIFSVQIERSSTEILELIEEIKKENELALEGQKMTQAYTPGRHKRG
ncbi:MAG: MotA/TolQ/ExbB proton channel family protein [Candidatus Aureabacteria bacterium]|nr:MotA/TolQ/ExbB proton channel family protein [Candidatus Auribacterota bacterium]